MSRRDRPNEAPMTFFSFQDLVSCTTGIMVLITLWLAMELLGLVPKPPGADTAALVRAVEDARRQRNEVAAMVEQERRTLAQLAAGVMVRATDIEAIEKSVQGLSNTVQSMVDRAAQIEAEQKLRARRGQELAVVVDSLGKEINELRAQIEREKNRPRVTLIKGGSSGKRALFVECSKTEWIVSEIPEAGPDRGRAVVLQRCAGADPPAEFVQWARGRNAAAESFVMLVRPSAADSWAAAAQALRELGFERGWDVWPNDRDLTRRRTEEDAANG